MSVTVSPDVERDEQRLEQVIAVVATAGHVQEQIELGRRGNRQVRIGDVDDRAAARVTNRAIDR